MSWFEVVAGVASVVSTGLAFANGVLGNSAAETTFKQGDAILNGGGGLALDAAGQIPKYGFLADAAQAGYHFSHSLYSAGRGNIREAGSELTEAALSTFSAATGGGITMGGKVLPKLQQWISRGVSARSAVNDATPFVHWGGGPTEYKEPPPPTDEQLDGGAPPGGLSDGGAPLSQSTTLGPMVAESPLSHKDHPAWVYAD